MVAFSWRGALIFLTPTGGARRFRPHFTPSIPMATDLNSWCSVDRRVFDPDGAIIDFVWKVNGATVLSGFGPTVQDFEFQF